MAEPSAYDIEQDARIETIESLVTAEYQPPAGVEYSFPVANQGITSTQYQQMQLAQGTATIIRDRSYLPYALVGHDNDSETNQRNTLMLRVAQRSGANEAIIEGFYHRMTEDMELPFPPVTSTTTYYVCLTFDPRRVKDPSGPIRVEV